MDDLPTLSLPRVRKAVVAAMTALAIDIPQDTQAPSAVQQAFSQVAPSHLRNHNKTATKPKVEDVPKRLPSDDDECPVCCDTLKGDELTFCATRCGGAVHVACMQRYIAAVRGVGVKCVLCRAPWRWSGETSNESDGSNNEHQSNGRRGLLNGRRLFDLTQVSAQAAREFIPSRRRTREMIDVEEDRYVTTDNVHDDDVEIVEMTDSMVEERRRRQRDERSARASARERAKSEQAVVTATVTRGKGRKATKKQGRKGKRTGRNGKNGGGSNKRGAKGQKGRKKESGSETRRETRSGVKKEVKTEAKTEVKTEVKMEAKMEHQLQGVAAGRVTRRRR